MIQPGDFVLYRFCASGVPSPRDARTGSDTGWKFDGEIMWVLVTDVSQGTIFGRLVSSPIAVPMEEDQQVVLQEGLSPWRRISRLSSRRGW